MRATCWKCSTEKVLRLGYGRQAGSEVESLQIQVEARVFSLGCGSVRLDECETRGRSRITCPTRRRRGWRQETFHFTLRLGWALPEKGSKNASIFETE